MVDYIEALPEKSLYATNMKGVARIYLNGSWDKFLDKLAQDPQLRRTIGEGFDSMGGDMDMDPQGRVTLPKNLRELLQLENKNVWLRLDEDRIFVYTEEQYAAQVAASKAAFPAELERAIAMGFDF
jgi:DNA-binding transcriptional regulator/RsmH inhibitor MraZ